MTVIESGNDGLKGVLPRTYQEFSNDTLFRLLRLVNSRTAAQKLRSTLSTRIANLTRLNPTRVDPIERFQKLLDDYCAGSVNVEQYFGELVRLSNSLMDEEQGHCPKASTRNSSRSSIYLTRPGPSLSTAEEKGLKRVAEELLVTLKRDKLALDWRKEQQTRAARACCRRRRA
jgi:type I restriction enzyme R subunit